MDLQAPTAILLKFKEDSTLSGEEEIDINLVERGDIVKVIPGT